VDRPRQREQTSGQDHLPRPVESPAAEALQVGDRVAKARRAEEDPAQAHEVEGRDLSQRPREPRLLPGSVAEEQAVPPEQQAVIGAPEHEVPARPVPQAAEQHGQEEVQVGAGGAATVAAERDVEVVAQPGRQGDVPALPELARTRRQVGPVEVLRQPDSEEARESDGHVAVAREVEVDLVGVGVDAEQQDRRRDLGRRFEAAIREGPQRVGEDHLLDETRGDAHRPVLEVGDADGRRRGELGQQLARPHDRARHQLREEGDVEGEVAQTAGGALAPPVDLERVAHGLEGVEGDADGQRDVEEGGQGRVGVQIEEGDPAAREEGAVLEEAEQAEVARDAGRQQQASSKRAPRALQQDADAEVEPRGEGE